MANQPGPGRNPPARPTLADRKRLLDQALAAVRDGRWAIPKERVAQCRGDLQELGLFTPDEIREGFEKAIEEIDPRSSKQYRGQFPPERSILDDCPGAELIVFVWESAFLTSAVYFKFAIVGEMLFVVSFHKPRPKNR